MASEDSAVANCIQAVAAVIMAIVALLALCTAEKQLNQAEEHRKWQNYNELNARYSEMLKDLQLQPEKGSDALSPGLSKEKLWATRYFDLTSEEFWLQQKKLLPEHTWACRIAPGIVANFQKLSFLTTEYEAWKKNHPRIHPANFVAEIERIRQKIPECPKKILE